MTRFTRSQRRNNAILEDEPTTGNENQAATESTVLATTAENRAPLGVIDVNEEAATVVAIGEMVTAGETTKGKAKGGKKGKGGRKGKKQPPIELVVETGKVDVVEDDEIVQESPASEEACRELLSGGEGSQKLPKLDSRPRTPPSRAVRETRKRLYRPDTPPKVQDSHVDMASEANGNEKEDSFVEKIISRTPGKHAAQLDESSKVRDMVHDGQACADDDENDSFVEKIIMRSPAKLITRIEDSVEAIDALEDAIEQIGEAIVEKSRTPKKGKKIVKADDKVNKGTKPPVAEPRTTRSSPRKQDRPAVEPKAVKAASTKKATESNPKSGTTKPTGKTIQERPTKKQPTVTAAGASNGSTSTASPTSPAAKRTISTKVTSMEAPTLKKRPVSVSFPPPPPPPARSTKPLTRPTFELPGEAISRKLKEQREERLKRALEEEQEKREFKAKPVRKSMAPVTVKGTASSRARESLMRGDANAAAATDKPGEPAGRRRSSSVGMASDVKRMSMVRPGEQLPVTKRIHLTNTSAARVISTSGSAISRKPSTSVHPGPASVKSTVTPADAAQQRFRGKEVFERDNKEKAERERIRREKEAAAKKAREEAAERGRQASREWAEKQKLKMKAAGAMGGAPSGAPTAIKA
ncbi:hypothetical protein FGG08_001912 [Glutinoglossum americanum]|uniref:Carboxylesterase family protein n=1 Tax=Glutinoglossum americanum TaxID=1670608 RepID=A0A9P8I639_9PEZI|nr:hypothetical protein FGG08_001912 [Glutinoglossum americanum]